MHIHVYVPGLLYHTILDTVAVTMCMDMDECSERLRPVSVDGRTAKITNSSSSRNTNPARLVLREVSSAVRLETTAPGCIKTTKKALPY